ncbi:MAG TPA: hypothetical protein VJR89_04795 [Polyangiales bacterium]|nr:hypothetical protein [Polyangiales bacterium]
MSLLAVGCARSALPVSSEQGVGAAGAAAGPAAAESCTPCGERLSAEQSLRCVCVREACPPDLDRARADLSKYAAYGTGCGHAWVVERSATGYALFVYERRSGELVYAQSAADGTLTCLDGSEQSLLEGGRAPMCEGEEVSWCRLARSGSPIGIGELDSARRCNERSLR